MNKTLITFFTILFCLTSSVGWSADFQKGMTAYKQGDFATALREWTPLAEQGNATAQSNLGAMYELGHGVVHNYLKGKGNKIILLGDSVSINREI